MGEKQHLSCGCFVDPFEHCDCPRIHFTVPIVEFGIKSRFPLCGRDAYKVRTLVDVCRDDAGQFKVDQGIHLNEVCLDCLDIVTQTYEVQK